jgi:hypothetical protein
MRKIAMVVSMLCLGMWVTSSTAMNDPNSVKDRAAMINAQAEKERLEKEALEDMNRRNEELKAEDKLHKDPIGEEIENEIPSQAVNTTNYMVNKFGGAPLPKGMELYDENGERMNCIPYRSELVGWLRIEEDKEVYALIAPTSSLTNGMFELKCREEEGEKEETCTTIEAKTKAMQEHTKKVTESITIAICMETVRRMEEGEKKREIQMKLEKERYDERAKNINRIKNTESDVREITLKAGVNARKNGADTTIDTE